MKELQTGNRPTIILQAWWFDVARCWFQSLTNKHYINQEQQECGNWMMNHPLWTWTMNTL